MTTTEKFGLPIVERGDTIRAEHWNDAYQILDNVCIGSKILFEKLVLHISTGEAIILCPDAPNMKFLQVIPTNPEDEAQFRAIAMASLQVYVEGENIHFKVLGIIPTITLNITVLGWY